MAVWLRWPLVWLLLGCLVQVQALAQTAPEFPPLTGRVVDQAEMLSPQTEARLNQMLAAHEQATTNQLVVATLPNLQGYEIADYGYQLGRHWGIGQKDKDNGALLIIARDEQKIRIEVGYGLEGELTDAASSVVISRVIAPEFREGRFEEGIVAGVEAMLAILGGEAIPAQAGQREQEGPDLPLPVLLFMLFFIIFGSFLGGGRRGRRYRRGIFYGGMAGGGFGGLGGGGFGGGFGGGGGGFGGGGASGGW